MKTDTDTVKPRRRNVIVHVSIPEEIARAMRKLADENFMKISGVWACAAQHWIKQSESRQGEL